MKDKTIRTEISKLELKKDDILVVKVKEYLSNVQYEELVKSLKYTIPESTKVLILDGGMSLEKLSIKGLHKIQSKTKFLEKNEIIEKKT